MKKTAAALSVLAVLAAATGRAASSGDSRLDRAIEKANREWGAAMKSGDAKTIASPYLDDAVFVGLDGACTRGRAAIERMYRDRFDRSGKAVSTRIEPHRVALDGAFAYEWGYGEITATVDGRPRTRGGPYLTVWSRQADGDWKILRNVVLP